MYVSITGGIHCLVRDAWDDRKGGGTMKNLKSHFYGRIPVCCLILLQTYEALEEKRNMNYEVTMTHYFCFLVLGTLICLGVLSSAHMERKCRVLISGFWVVVIPLVYVLLFANILTIRYLPVSIYRMEFPFLLEGIYLLMLINDFIGNRKKR